MNRIHFILLLALLALPLGAGTVLWWLHRTVGFSSPHHCLTSYYEAIKKGDTEKGLSCLDPVVVDDLIEIWGSHEKLVRHLTAESGRCESWSVETDEGIGQSAGHPDVRASVLVVVEKYAATSYRVAYRLDYRPHTGWLISGIQVRSPMELTIPWDRRFEKTPPQFEKQ